MRAFFVRVPKQFEVREADPGPLAWDRVLNTNLRGAFLCARAAACQMVRQGQGGVIINNSSMHESVPRLGLTHYAVSKAGLQMLAKGLEAI